MPDSSYAEVATCLRDLVGRSCDLPGPEQVVLRVLSRPGRVLSPQGPARWPNYVLLPCRLLGGEDAHGVLAAAAVELAVAAGDVVDDVVDGDWEGPAGDSARAVNASLGLLALAQQCLSSIDNDLSPRRNPSLGDILTRGVLAACAGQDLDLTLESEAVVSEEAAHDMTVRKSGSLIATACQLGAACASDDGAVVELAGVFGRHLGTLAQLLNDIDGIAGESSDLRRQKKTLPVAYALRCAREENLRGLSSWYDGLESTAYAKERELAALIQETGALHYAWVVADAHRREALAALAALGRASGRREVSDLRRLLPSLRPRGSQAAAK